MTTNAPKYQKAAGTDTATHVCLRHHHSTGQAVTFYAEIFAYTRTGNPIVVIPKRVRELKFAPFDGRRVVTLSLAKIATSLARR